jgi:hypothetical protein
VKGLALSILEICDYDKLRKSMSEYAEKLSQEERFSLPHIHQIFERTYAEILDIPLVENGD